MYSDITLFTPRHARRRLKLVSAKTDEESEVLAVLSGKSDGNKKNTLLLWK